MTTRMMQCLWLFVILGTTVGPPASADLPPSCSGLPCNLESDLVIFRAGLSDEIVATIHECTACPGPGTGTSIDLEATFWVEFGPYDPAIIGCDSSVAEIQFAGELLVHPEGGPAEYYAPADPDKIFDAVPLPPAETFDTECVSDDWLDYTMLRLHVSGAEGARTAEVASGWAATLTLPESVRSTWGSRLTLPPFRVSQGLAFALVETHDPVSTLRFWPEGHPFRLGPYEVVYRPGDVSWTVDGASGSTPYEVVHPDPSALPANGYGIRQCTVVGPNPSIPCTSPPIWNAGYLDSPAWSPSAGSFDLAGLNVDLTLAGGAEVVYRPLFPQGTWIQLIGPATVGVAGSEITGGGFDAGRAWLQNNEGMGWCEVVDQHSFDLLQSPGPQITDGGGLVAGVADLNAIQNLRWMQNQASGLGCGTLWVPPPVHDVLDEGTVVGPQHEWLRSAEEADHPGIFFDPVRGRGIYAGFNYNRNRICTAGQIGQFCGRHSDCGLGGQCERDRWSPLCPPSPPSGFDPRWITEFQGNTLNKPIHPAEGDKEMVLVARASGVTGVFDAGDDVFSITQPFAMEFNSFGHAFRASQSEWADTIIRGGLEFPWPALTSIPFNDMTMCNCGSAKAAGSGEPPTENRLAYWDATFYPYGLTFLETVADDCADPAASACGPGAGSAAGVCVEATMPIPHFDPVPTVKFRVAGDGNADQIVPLDTPVFQFDAVEPPGPALTPYEYAAEEFRLSSWTGAGSPTQPAVENNPLVHYGYYDSVGDLALPFFGQVPAGIQVRSLDGEHNYQVELHEEGDPAQSAPYVPVTKKAAADKLDLSYRIDYFRPDWTADPNDGSNVNGRGLMLGYSGLGDTDRNLDLGSIKVPSAVVLTPDTIVAEVGPAASMRLWGATEGFGRSKLDSILPPVNLQPPAVATYESGLAAVGLPGHALTPPDDGWIETLYGSGAMAHLAAHPADAVRPYNTEGDPTDPGMNASSLTGYLAFTGDELERVLVDANVDTNGQFFAMNRSTLTVDRHVKHNSPEQPIAQLGRRNQPDNMALPGNMSVPFPDVPDVPGLQWDFEYDFSGGTPVFQSLTGSLDLTQGGLSGIGFDRAGMTLKYWNDGDWYFDAGLELNFNGYRAFGDILLGNTKNLDPLWAKDPTVVDFLGPIPAFKGGYVSVGASGRIFNYGCLLRVSAGFQVAGWYITDSYGGKLRGWVSGKGACLVSVRGDLTLMGGSVGDRFKMTGLMWVGGGIGVCEEEDWDTPADVLDDDFCASCVISGSITGITPPKFKMSMSGPDVDCSL